mmetsp:Transcript_13865/g.24163  ORF Transcript_13865/g.24163 Transcript_13865/m.24163 type:complete len:623 (+) Transcript_13865:77-1945(+)
MCGILGLLLAHQPSHANQLLFDGLTVLQHRGQDAAGIATCEHGRVHLRKDNGLVKDVFQQADMLRLRGNMGIGHTRYPTAGGSSNENAQPFYVGYPYGLCCAHNGNLTNVAELRQRSSIANRHINTDSDSELLLNAFAEALSQVMPKNGGVLTSDSLFKAVRAVLNMTRGGYSVLILISGVGMLAFRDIHGIRPLVIGHRRSAQEPDLMDYMVASESVATDTLGFTHDRDLEPGEAVFFDSRDNSMHNRQCYYKRDQPKLSPCIFEYVYFARPDSVMDGVSVYESRIRMGTTLAKKVQRQLTDWECIDVVIPVPDTSRTSAIAVAEALERPFREAFQKNRYIARTFIMPGQDVRKKTVRLKLNTIKGEFRGKNVLLVDDSVVRGTTSIEIIQLAREAGAAKVFFASAAPPVRHPNVYGIDLPSRNELIASGRTDSEIALMIGADDMIYQDLEDLIESVRSCEPRRFENGFDASVFDGRYVTGDVEEAPDMILQFDCQDGMNRSDGELNSGRASSQCSLASTAGIDESFDRQESSLLCPVDVPMCSFASPIPSPQSPHIFGKAQNGCDTRKYANQLQVPTQMTRRKYQPSYLQAKQPAPLYQGRRAFNKKSRCINCYAWLLRK